MTLNNQDLDLLKQVQTILKVKVTTGAEKEILQKFNTLFNTLMKKKTVASKRSGEYNKRNKKRHSILNAISYARKTGNQKKLEYWQNQHNILIGKEKTDPMCETNVHKRGGEN